jgi:putative zinc finger/helix-turn-helix YgiT family protein
MRKICPNCEKEREVDLIRANETIDIRGESIGIDVEYFKCKTCGEEFEDPRSEKDPLSDAYREYRRRHETTQPEDTKALRKLYGLTQTELAKLLGWGGATLSRYENGALQDDAHEKTLRLIKEPHNLLKLINQAPKALLESKRKRLEEELLALENETYSLERIFEERFGKYSPDEYSGYKSLNLDKLFNAVLFFCMEGVIKTVLNKLLFYSEFKHFKENTVSITGSRYARIRFGPAPDRWRYFFTLLIEEEMLDSEEIFYDEDVTGEKYTSLRSPDISVFSNDELKTLISVKEKFKGWTAKRISDFSHQERGYQETQNGKLISYRYAEYLQI